MIITNAIALIQETILILAQLTPGKEGTIHLIKTPYQSFLVFLMEYVPEGSKYYEEDPQHISTVPKNYLKTLESYLDKAGLIWLPIYKYDHGGITYNTTGFSCSFDSGQVGHIFEEKKNIKKEFNVKRVSQKLKNKILNRLSC